MKPGLYDATRLPFTEYEGGVRAHGNWEESWSLVCDPDEAARLAVKLRIYPAWGYEPDYSETPEVVARLVARTGALDWSHCFEVLTVRCPRCGKGASCQLPPAKDRHDRRIAFGQMKLTLQSSVKCDRHLSGVVGGIDRRLR